MISHLKGTRHSFQPICVSLDLGLISYGQAVEIQEKMVHLRATGALPDILLLAEHPPTFTIGHFRRGHEFKVSPASLLARGLAICHSDRGGGVVYHGPGQLLVYPILSLKQLGLNVLQYVRSLEEMALQVLEAFHIRGNRKPGFPGVWVGAAKIGFIGLHISRGISKHGLALNVDPDLRYFNYIDCCGIPQVAVTSMAKFRAASLEMSLVKEKMLEAFHNVFPFKLGKVSHVCDG